MKELKLFNSTKIALVDDEDYERLLEFKWYSNQHGCVQYFSNIRRRNIALASVIMRKHLTMFDHKDRNPLNNQKSNLRPATVSQNGMNRRKQDNKTSKYKGVFWNTQKNKWNATIKKNGKTKHLGFFKDEIIAAKTYDKWAIVMFGEFANPNFNSEIITET